MTPPLTLTLTQRQARDRATRAAAVLLRVGTRHTITPRAIKPGGPNYGLHPSRLLAVTIGETILTSCNHPDLFTGDTAMNTVDGLLHAAMRLNGDHPDRRRLMAAYNAAMRALELLGPNPTSDG
jgi:hypothetical protein